MRIIRHHNKKNELLKIVTSFYYIRIFLLFIFPLLFINLFRYNSLLTLYKIYIYKNIDYTGKIQLSRIYVYTEWKGTGGQYRISPPGKMETSASGPWWCVPTGLRHASGPRSTTSYKASDYISRGDRQQRIAPLTNRTR